MSSTASPTVYAPRDACTDSYNYGIWTKDDGLSTGFEKFSVDLGTCLVACGTLLGSSTSVVYGCGGFARPSCAPNQFQICVGDCLTHKAPMDNVDDLLQLENYSATCVGCMGEFANCEARNCTAQCVAGARDAPYCQMCNAQKCNPSFQLCSGLDVRHTKRPTTEPTAMPTLTPTLPVFESQGVPALAGTLGGLAVLLLVLVVGCFVYKKNRAMSPNDLARMAGAQGIVLPQASENNPVLATSAYSKVDL